MPKIRPSVAADVPAIARIYAHHVNSGTGTFETEAPGESEMATRRSDVLSKGLPFLVIEEAGSVLGYAYCNWFKPRAAYRYSAEDSIYLSPEASGKGLGKLLLTELITQAERAGVRKLIAVIGDSDNKGSIGLHKSCGFEDVGILTSCGWKFGRWLDVVMMDRALGMADKAPPQDS